MDTAASTDFQFQGGSSQNYAISVDTAISIAEQIEAGHASSTVHIGEAAFIGVVVESAGGFGGAASGAEVVGVEPGSPAQSLGLSSGDVIDSLNGMAVDSAQSLLDIMESLHPGDVVSLTWTDSPGVSHTAEVQLAAGPVE